LLKLFDKFHDFAHSFFLAFRQVLPLPSGSVFSN
jgi:hypothetical protein